MGPSVREPIGTPSWSVTIPVMNAPSIPQRMADANSALQGVSTTRGKVPEPTGESASGSSKLPKQGKTQTPARKKGDRPGSVTIVK